MRYINAVIPISELFLDSLIFIFCSDFVRPSLYRHTCRQMTKGMGGVKGKQRAAASPLLVTVLPCACGGIVGLCFAVVRYAFLCYAFVLGLPGCLHQQPETRPVLFCLFSGCMYAL